MRFKVETEIHRKIVIFTKLVCIQKFLFTTSALFPFSITFLISVPQYIFIMSLAASFLSLKSDQIMGSLLSTARVSQRNLNNSRRCVERAEHESFWCASPPLAISYLGFLCEILFVKLCMLLKTFESHWPRKIPPGGSQGHP
jgi:hypothetical protein